jgi:hypothetical protein
MKTSLENYTQVVRGRYAPRNRKLARKALPGDCQVTRFESANTSIKMPREQRRREARGKLLGGAHS